MPRLAPILLSALFAFLIACEEDERPGVVWVGETIHYATDHPEELCGGTLEYLDRRASVMTATFAGPDRIDYFWVKDVSDFCFGGVEEDRACTIGNEIYAEDAILVHEIAHVRGGDRMTAVLEEGLAVHFGDPLPLESLSPRQEFIDALHSLPSRYLGGYSRAGHFAAFISETYGWETLLELDAAIDREATLESVDAAFSSIVGVDLDDVLAIYADYPDCLNIVDNSIACAANSDGEYDWWKVEYERVVDCSSPTGLGPNGGWAFVEGVIELADDIDDVRSINMVGHANGGAIHLTRCGPCSEGGALVVRDPWVTATEEELPPGRYLVRLFAPADAGPTTIGISIQ